MLLNKLDVYRVHCNSCLVKFCLYCSASTDQSGDGIVSVRLHASCLALCHKNPELFYCPSLFPFCCQCLQRVRTLQPFSATKQLPSFHEVLMSTIMVKIKHWLKTMIQYELRWASQSGLCEVSCTSSKAPRWWGCFSQSLQKKQYSDNGIGKLAAHSSCSSLSQLAHCFRSLTNARSLQTTHCSPAYAANKE